MAKHSFSTTENLILFHSTCDLHTQLGFFANALAIKLHRYHTLAHPFSVRNRFENRTIKSIGAYKSKETNSLKFKIEKHARKVKSFNCKSQLFCLLLTLYGDHKLAIYLFASSAIKLFSYITLTFLLLVFVQGKT